MLMRFWLLTIALLLAGWAGANASEPAAPKKVVLIAGPITGHPKHTHEYEKSVILLKHLLDTSPSTKGKVVVEAHFKGWPVDEKTLDDAATIVMISDGGDRKATDHPLYVGERFQTLERQMKRGCGFVQFHWTTFNPSRVHDQITEWVGGYFDYETGTAANKWFSAIQTWDANVTLGSAEHPIARGVKPFTAREEFYYNLRFRDGDDRVKPIWLTKPPGQQQDHIVAWAVERKDGGRGFGTTGGHFFQNWWDDNFRRTILNAIVWTAGVEVPAGGVISTMEAPIRVLIVTGHNHPAHDWRKTTAALIPVLEQDPRVWVEVTENPEELANISQSHRDGATRYDALVLNYSSWDRPGLSDAAKGGLKKFLDDGGGLSIIHFANGSWTDTLPNKEADWPEFRTQIVRRIWDHKPGLSGHDPFGTFRVDLTAAGEKHPVTAGLASFETDDELYFRQQGSLPIVPLVTAHSKVTKQDEPLAWVYEQSKARVFQTVLGHADVSIRKAGALIRRGTVWTARREPLSFDPPVAITENSLFRAGSPWTLEESLKRGGIASAEKAARKTALAMSDGKFGKALDSRIGGAFVNHRDEFRALPLTVELWAKLDGKGSYNILVANELKSSPTHWEIFTMPGSGHLTVFAPGLAPDHVRSTTDIADGQWHFVAMRFEPTRIRLFVDGKPVADQAVKAKEEAFGASRKPAQGELAVGSLVDQGIGCDGVIDDLRISRGVRPMSGVPTEALKADESTIALWNFDTLTEGASFDDSSAGKFKAWLPGSADGIPASAKKK
jgi:type 1 glutamine amidotransferase